METLRTRGSKPSRIGAGLFGLVLLAACGDALVGGDYRGTPLVSFRGSVVGSSNELDLKDNRARVSLFFATGGPRTFAHADLTEQVGATHLAELPFAFTINVFDPPPPSLLYTEPDGTRYGIGTFLAYADKDKDGRNNGTEKVIGSTRARVILYAPTELPAERSPTGSLLPAGYHLVTPPLACGRQRQGMVLPRCEVPALGQRCTTDGDCGAGICVKDSMFPWPQGACVLPNPPPNGCVPEGAVFLPGMKDSFWIKGCTTSADCGRPFPYQCDQSFRGCMPTALLSVIVSGMPEAPPFCRN